MATELANAYVQIVPSMKGIKGSLSKEMGGEGTASGQAFGASMVGKIKTVIAAAGIGKALAATITEGADLQQSIGGIETLFKESAEKVKQNAQMAYKTAGMSANEYMEQTTSFAASLLQSLGNDTAKAADMADMAMTDMSDNANKMGTDMEMIQNAYQGFAKQNYTMLDNLKLGYGGTKEEMQRLLKDAQKITGVKYDIKNLSDVYSAIHVIQGELDITGTTAKEASSTISGSFAAVKASLKNVMGQLTLGEDIRPALEALAASVVTFLSGNLLPAIWNILSALPEALYTFLMALAPSIMEGVNFLFTQIQTFMSELPQMSQGINTLITNGLMVMQTRIPEFLQKGLDFVSNIVTGILNSIPTVIQSAGNLIEQFLTVMKQALPQMLNSGIDFVSNIVTGILNKLPDIISSAMTLVTKFINAILPMLPQVLQAGVKLLLNLVNGIIQSLPKIVSSAAEAVAKFLAKIGSSLPQILQSGIEIIGELAAGLIKAIPDLVSKIPQIIKSIIDEFANTDWLSVGKNIITGIANGLASMAGALWDAVKGLLGSFKDQVLGFFGIHSPSRWGIYVGEMVDEGIAKGLTGGVNPINKAITDVTGAVSTPIETDLRYTLTRSQSSETTGTPKVFYEILKVLIMLLNKDGDIKLYLKDREVGRALREMGVVFS